MDRRKASINWKSIMTPAFMKKHTAYDSLIDFMASGGFVIKKLDDVADFEGEALDHFIAGNTGFSGWSEMLSTAVGDYLEQTFRFYDF
ncbi:hypothetical protein D3C75_251170 [compost metagenome]